MLDIKKQTTDRLPAAAGRLSPAAAVITAATTMIVILIAGCGSTEPVCQGAPERILLVPSTSYSDLATDRALAPAVAQQAVGRAAASCGRLLVGLQDNRPEADLDLQTVDFTPRHRGAYNRKPEISQLVTMGETFVQVNLIKLLAKIQPTYGSRSSARW